MLLYTRSVVEKCICERVRVGVKAGSGREEVPVVQDGCLDTCDVSFRVS